ncbi:MAG: amino acid ABC transporter ATP-binding protein [Anaerolineales bacterium]|nr:amino acid ABC transporter ATP-binding protein [Anaerolineales bacterium]
MSSIVCISNLNKHFDQVHVLKDVSFEVAPAEVICIIGRSGSGKSTLLRCVNFLEQPEFGSVEVDGVKVEAGGKGREYQQQIHELRLKTGMVFQSFNLFAHMTALENVIEGPVTVKGMPKKQAIELGMHNLEKVGLANKRDQYPSRLSGGQQQRVAIARALVNEPAIILADEPTGNLDSKSGTEVMQIFQQLNRERGITVVFVTHDPWIARHTHRVVTLADGKIVRDEQIDEPLVAGETKRPSDALLQ